MTLHVSQPFRRPEGVLYSGHVIEPRPKTLQDPAASAVDLTHAHSLLVVYARDHARIGQRVPIDGSLVIGRQTTAFGGRPMTDPRMSRQHAAVHLEGDRLVLVDGGSTNGTLVNALPVRTTTLGVGDVAQIGTTFFHFGRHAVVDADTGGSLLQGVSVATETLRRELGLVAPTTTTVLIAGEPGVGKRTAARELHRLSGRSGELLTVECGSSAPEDVEQRLFGDRSTGPVIGPPATGSALRRDPAGTLLLADVDQLSITAQVRLLWALEHGGRAAGTLPRLVVTTTRDLAEAVADGSFRHDLRQRLIAWPVEVEPLGARRPDVGALAASFVDRFVSGHSGVPLHADPRLIWRLLSHPWPHNVAELATVVEAACVEACAGDRMLQETPRLARLLEVRSGRRAAARLFSQGAVPSPRGREELIAVLERNDWVIAHVARHYGKHRQQVYRWLDRFEIDVEALRRDSA